MAFSPRRLFLLASLLWLNSGCSGRDWMARFYMFRAESAFDRAHKLRVKEDLFNLRLRYYRKACDGFFAAYRRDPRVFTLYRIELAVEACLRVENKEAEQALRAFEEKYAQEHPVEVEYGDAFPMNIE